MIGTRLGRVGTSAWGTGALPTNGTPPEPTPAVKVLMNGKVSLTPHIGAATGEAQDRIGTELAAHIDSLAASL